MRTFVSALSALLPATRIGLLTATFMQPEKWWYLSELARRLGTSASSLQRELAALTEAGILLRSADGNRVYYRANTDGPLFPELQGLIVKTTGLVDVLRSALEPLAKRIRMALVYGSVARGEATAESDVDLLVVGELGLADLAPLLPPVAIRLGRPVNPTVFAPDEFAAKLTAGHRFLRTVLDDKPLFVIGNARDLGGPPSPATPAADPG